MRNETCFTTSKIKATTSLAAGVLVILLTSSGLLMAEGARSGNDPFLLQLKGIYRPVVNAPNLGLSLVNLNDGSYSVTQIHSVIRVPGSSNESDAVIGHFYVQFNGPFAAYDLPGGAILMQFTSGGFPTQIPDGQGGVYLEGTFELTILEATGIYRSFVGGHNHMVDRLHLLANGRVDENCFCIISLAADLPLWWSEN